MQWQPQAATEVEVPFLKKPPLCSLKVPQVLPVCASTMQFCICMWPYIVTALPCTTLFAAVAAQYAGHGDVLNAVRNDTKQKSVNVSNRTAYALAADLRNALHGSHEDTKYAHPG